MLYAGRKKEKRRKTRVSNEDTAKALLLVAGILLIFAFIGGVIYGAFSLMSIIPYFIISVMDPLFGTFFIPIILSGIAFVSILIVFGIIDLVLSMICFTRRSNPTNHWGGLLFAGIIGVVTGYGIGILVIVAAILARQSVDMHQVQPRRVSRSVQRPARRTRRISRSERLRRFRDYDQQIVKSMQAAQKSFKGKRWRTVVKHTWTATEALLTKLYEINFDEPPPHSLSEKQIIQRLTPHLPGGRETAAAITEVLEIRSKIKPKSARVKQADAEKVLAAAHQLCFWFNIQLDTEREPVQPMLLEEETVPEGVCGVCNLQHRPGQRVLTTPCCDAVCHYACLSEWVKVKQVCPRCREKLRFRSGKVRIRR
jgi:hypothetical protein